MKNLSTTLFRVHSDYRGTQYCYGLSSSPSSLEMVLKVYQWFEKESKYFKRDQENLLYGIGCGKPDSFKRSLLMSDVFVLSIFFTEH